jgi:hypothetical protein
MGTQPPSLRPGRHAYCEAVAQYVIFLFAVQPPGHGYLGAETVCGYKISDRVPIGTVANHNEGHINTGFIIGVYEGIKTLMPYIQSAQKKEIALSSRVGWIREKIFGNAAGAYQR